MASTSFCPRCGANLPLGAVSQDQCALCSPTVAMVSERPLPQASTETGVQAERPQRFRNAEAFNDDLTIGRSIAKPLNVGRQAKYIVFFEAIFMLVCLAGIFAETERIGFVQDVVAKRIAFDERQAERIDLFPQTMAFVSIGVGIVAQIALLVWFYRAYRNLESLGCEGQTATPGWAVGSWFIPFYNLYRPYQIAQEIWRGSDPDYLDRYAWNRAPSGTRIGFWWFMHIIVIVASRLDPSSDAKTPQQILFGLQVVRVTYALSILVSIAVLAMVLPASARQEEKFRRLTNEPLPEEPIEQDDYLQRRA